jgi:hypothetical protein
MLQFPISHAGHARIDTDSQRSDDNTPSPRCYHAGVEYESLLVLLAACGAPPDADALDALEDARPVWVRIEREGRSVCLAARVRHADRPEEFRTRVRGWGVARGWAVTVAPCAPSV